MPLSSGLRFEYTVNSNQTVNEFEKLIVDSSEGQIKNFKLSRVDLTG